MREHEKELTSIRAQHCIGGKNNNRQVSKPFFTRHIGFFRWISFTILYGHNMSKSISHFFKSVVELFFFIKVKFRNRPFLIQNWLHDYFSNVISMCLLNVQLDGIFGLFFNIWFNVLQIDDLLT